MDEERVFDAMSKEDTFEEFEKRINDYGDIKINNGEIHIAGKPTMKFKQETFTKNKEMIDKQVKTRKINDDELTKRSKEALNEIYDNNGFSDEQLNQVKKSFKKEIQTKISNNSMEKIDIDRNVATNIANSATPEELQTNLEKLPSDIQEKLSKVETSIEELSKKLEERSKQTDNIEEKNMCKKMKERLDEEIEKNKKEGKGTDIPWLTILFILFTAGFLKAEQLINSGCMVYYSDSKTNNKCKSKEFTASIYNVDSSNYCQNLGSDNTNDLCKKNPIINTNDNVPCQPEYQKKLTSDEICTVFCDGTYLISSNQDKSFTYKCESCDLVCSLEAAMTTLINTAYDSFDLLTNLLKWIPYIAIGFLLIIGIWYFISLFKDNSSTLKIKPI